MPTCSGEPAYISVLKFYLLLDIAWTCLTKLPLSVLANMRRCCSHPPDHVSCMLCGCVFCYGASWRGREGNPTVNLVNAKPDAKHRNAPQFECCKQQKGSL
jgi:hypothetical protein